MTAPVARPRSRVIGLALGRCQSESRRSTGPIRFRKGLAALAALISALACGPSVQSIYEGDVRFEHCYRLDLEVDTAPTHREACWKEWLGRYTYGQPRDRIEYARRRVHAFAAGDTARPRLDIGQQSAADDRPFYVVAPAPTSVHASPPPVVTPVYADAGPPAEPAAPKPTVAPKDKCSNACRSAYEDCLGPCDADAGKPDSRCKSCEPDYTGCMKRCFQ